MDSCQVRSLPLSSLSSHEAIIALAAVVSTAPRSNTRPQAFRYSAPSSPRSKAFLAKRIFENVQSGANQNMEESALAVGFCIKLPRIRCQLMPPYESFINFATDFAVS